MINIKVSTQPQFTGVPAEVALAMFDLLMEQEELIDRGERCDKCGDLHLPEDLTQGLCGDCSMDMAIDMVERLIKEVIAESIAQEIEDAIMEEIEAQKEEEKELEEMAEMLKLIALLSDDFPIDLRMF